jgi:hypothetical protein
MSSGMGAQPYTAGEHAMGMNAGGARGIRVWEWL